MKPRLLAFALMLMPSLGLAADPIRLANTPALSPDGSILAFSWAGEIWTVPSEGGMAKPLTRHPARDTTPKFSPDGKEIAFGSDREGSNQVFTIAADGSGTPKQVTFNTAGSVVQGYYPDGQSLLVHGTRDYDWYEAGRFFKVKKDDRAAEELLFNDYGDNGAISPDGMTILFTREGTRQWWRKGYRGSESSQVWWYVPASKTFTKLLETDGGALWPMWKPDGKGFFYVAVNEGAFNLWDYDLITGKTKPLTALKDDSVVFPCISKDGSTIVFRHLFDLYRYRPGKDDAPQKLVITRGGDGAPDPIDRRTVTSADSVSFSRDGLEIAFVAGGDLWVMDTELMEPKRILDTPEEERDATFSPDGESLIVVSDKDGQSDLYRVERGDANLYWWQNATFKVERITNDAETETAPRFSPDGSKIAYVKGRGDLVVMDAKGKDAKVVVPGWDRPEYDWSPDGQWLVYAQADNDFNTDIYVIPSDGSKPAFNVSRHPDVDASPVWSPDGKTIAFTGRRGQNEVDLYYVFVNKEDDDKETRDRTVEKALEKMTKARKKGATSASKKDDAKKDADEKKDAEVKKPPVKVTIDFDGIHERVKHVAIPESTETNLFWSPDSKKLAFSATIDGRAGVYTIEPPDDVKPKLLTASVLTQARWLETNNQVVGLVAGSPTSLPGGGGGASPAAGGARGAGGAGAATPTTTPPANDGTYRIRARQEIDLSKKHRAAFELAWRAMRDNFYDERLGNRNWDAIRRKYADAAAEAPDSDGLATVVNLMLGELNGSHLGYVATSGRALARPTPGAAATAPAGGKWTAVTAHLGLRFDPAHKGPGLKVKDVLTDGPADKKKTRIEPGELVISIDGVIVDPSMDLTKVLNGPIDRDLTLVVRSLGGKDLSKRFLVVEIDSKGKMKAEGAAIPGESETLVAALAKLADSTGKKPVLVVIAESAAKQKETLVALAAIGELNLALHIAQVKDGEAFDGMEPKERTIRIRPISDSALTPILYEKGIKDARKAVDAASKKKLGYLHIRGMDFPSFHRFEQELYAVGAGKDGLIIDVRNNGGGSTTDHLLTALTQPVHAIAVPRGGGPGYPQDRMIYATWNKPIVVLCNQNSFSNAEIFSHAIKTLKRGQLVGVTTAGGVISTGGIPIMDLGFLRMPTRGWYTVNDGEDMELHGAVPDHVVWPAPGEMAEGKDAQLSKAVEVLLKDVEAYKAKVRPKLKKSSER